MLSDVEIIGILKSFVRKTLEGVGALKGAPCEIQSITAVDNTHVVTFEWEDKNGDTHTNTMTVLDGAKNIGDLKDVDLTGLGNEDILYYDSSSSKFKVIDAGAVSEAEYTAIESLLS